MSERVYVVRLTEEQRAELVYVARKELASADGASASRWGSVVRALESARPEPAGRRAAVENLVAAAIGFSDAAVGEMAGAVMRLSDAIWAYRSREWNTIGEKVETEEGENGNT